MKFMENTGNQLKLLPKILDQLDTYADQLAAVGSRLHRHDQRLARMDGQPRSEEGAVDQDERDAAASAAATATDAAARATATETATVHARGQEGAWGLFP